jgi:hypothetical protein
MEPPLLLVSQFSKSSYKTSTVLRVHNLNIKFSQHKFAMLLSSILTLGLAAIAYALPTTEILRRDGPDRGQVYIQRLSWGGSGCPAHSVSNFTSDDGQT